MTPQEIAQLGLLLGKARNLLTPPNGPSPDTIWVSEGRFLTGLKFNGCTDIIEFRLDEKGKAVTDIQKNF